MASASNVSDSFVPDSFVPDSFVPDSLITQPGRRSNYRVETAALHTLQGLENRCALQNNTSSISDSLNALSRTIPSNTSEPGFCSSAFTIAVAAKIAVAYHDCKRFFFIVVANNKFFFLVSV
jgi:hypothetical protein